MDPQRLGVMEIFFGPPWTPAERISWAEFLGREQLGFYLYGPKADARLRKNWREPWPASYQAEQQSLAQTFHQHGVKFGVAFSPFGLEYPLTSATSQALAEKCRALQDLGVDFLGLFFDDMPVTVHLAKAQVSALAIVQENFRGQILFCPSFYSFDPVLEKVFGKCPPHYLEDIAQIPAGVEILWTGPKVISEEIPAEHLREVTTLLHRPPYLGDNFYANDGPRNCKFLKLKPFTGRPSSGASYLALNPMNQARLSQLMVKAAKSVLINNQNPAEAFRAALQHLPKLLRDFELFTTQGLDRMSPSAMRKLRLEYAENPDPAAQEVARWLAGDYLVGSECLTD